MIIYKDKVFGDELFTDASRPKLDEEGLCFVFDTKYITVKEGDIDGALLGANASAEEAQEECESQTTSNFDFVIANRLQEVEPTIDDKKKFQYWAKLYFKELLSKATSKEDEAEIKENCKKFVAKYALKVKDLSFYGSAARENSSGDAVQGNIVLVEWNDDGVSGKAYCLRSALTEEKV